MTRTELIALAQRVINNPVDVYDDFSNRGTVYTSSYRKKAISVFQSFRNVIICVTYNNVCYFINPTDLTTAQNLRSFLYESKVHTKVYLYPRSRQLFIDEEGSINSNTDKMISKAMDYSDVIPIAF